MIVLRNEPMSRHTSFRAGGNARKYLIPENEAELVRAVPENAAGGELCAVIGNGSNLLVSDSGFDGTVIEVGRSLSRISLEGCVIRAEAGISLAQLAGAAKDASLAGLEFASGIPGTLGGACVMNAGAYGGQMADVLKSVRVADENGQVFEVDAAELRLGYRFSVIPQKKWTVLSAVLELKRGNREEISALMGELNAKRREKQPLEFPSAGSTFKRPEGHFAGRLIEEAGLKGYRCGGAMVSEKHAGFVINYDRATASDIYRLTCDIIDRVYEKSGIILEREIKLLGSF